tara:strand:+ start:42 stop:377 length:336 start_codon:yes stop_codon:yes gene_type:complete
MTQLNKSIYLPSVVLTHILSYCDDRIERKQQFLNKQCFFVIKNIDYCLKRRDIKIDRIWDLADEYQCDEGDIFRKALAAHWIDGKYWNLELTMSYKYVNDYNKNIRGQLII